MLNLLAPFLRARFAGVLLLLTALSALIWTAGPELRLLGIDPLATPRSRALVIGSIVLVVILVIGVRYWRARRANARLIGKLMDSDSLVPLSETKSNEEVEFLRERFVDALKVLRETRISTAHGTGFLLDLPWYVIIGPPGSGKTTILRNSGLDFPLADRLGADVLAGIGGTRNCDWWFTNEGVLLDTAGRYTTQDSNQVIDRAAWRGFLDLLREFRRRRPLNGVLLAISLGDVLLQDEAKRAEHVDIFRRRLQELMRAFGMRLPVYLLITKCDLLAGFTEFFDTLTEPEREQIWGITFAPEQADAALASAYEAGFSDLLSRVLDRMPVRLHEERDSVRRRQIFAFPQQFAETRGIVGAFVNEVFRPNRYELAPMLRGVFFTSGTQEGTPIDRLMSNFARAFGLAVNQVPPPTGKGRTFFVRQVLSEMVFAERGLVGTNRKLERRLAITHALGYAAAAAVAAVLGTVWFSAYAHSNAEVRALSAQANQLQTLGGGPSRPVADMLPELDAARKVAGFFDKQGFFEGWVYRVGLSSLGLEPEARAVYRRVLLTDLLPQIEGQMQGQLAADMQQDVATPVLHDMLALYLMLNMPEHFDRVAYAHWLTDQANATFPLDPIRRASLEQHYSALLADLPRRVPIDPDLVQAARARLVRIPQAQAVYAHLRSDADHDPALHPFSFLNAVGTQGAVAFADPSGSGLRTVVPGFFTRDGFYNGFVARLPLLVRNEMQSDWVLGQDSSAPSVAAAEQVIHQVAALYSRDYIAAWQGAIGRIELTRWTSFDGLQSVLQALIGPGQPLNRILDSIRVNTDLPRLPDATPGGAAVAVQSGALPGDAAGAAPLGLGGRLVQAVAGTAAAAPAVVGLTIPDPWPGDDIRQPFQQLLALTATSNGGQEAVSTIDDQIGAVYAVINQIASTEDPSAAALRYVSTQQRSQAYDAASVLRNGAATRPEPIRSIMLQVANSVAGTISGGARQRVASIWRSQVLTGCQAVVGNRYPFVRNAAAEVPLTDFADFFKTGGTVDQFAKSLAQAAPDPLGVAAPGRPPPLPANLQKQITEATRIRDGFFAGGTDLGFKFTITARSLDNRLAKATIEIDGKSIVYRHDPPRAVEFDWPGTGDQDGARIILNDFKSDHTVFDEQGPWALFRLMEDLHLTPTGRPGMFSFSVEYDGERASFLLNATGSASALQLSDLRNFRCYDAN